MLKFGVIFTLAIVFIALTPSTFAQEQTVKISTEQETYYYGDFLTFTIEVSKIIEEIAIMHITDDAGIKSSAIPIPISEQTTTLTSPFPFDPTTYPEGQYVIDIEYSGINSSTEFYLKDSGKIVIPIWIKDVGKMWTQGLITDDNFVDAIEFLIKNNIIIIQETESSESGESSVPSWVKTTTSWWAEGLVSDNEFGQALEHLIKIGVIVV